MKLMNLRMPRVMKDMEYPFEFFNMLSSGPELAVLKIVNPTIEVI